MWGFDLQTITGILFEGLIQGIVSGIVVVASYLLGRRQSNLDWQRDLAQRDKEWQRNKPKLAVVYSHEPPLARLSGRVNEAGQQLGPFFDFHIRIENRSRSQHAQRVEAVLEKMWEYNESGDPIPVADFLSIRLRYDSKGTEFVDINPQRHIIWNLGYLPNPGEQQKRLSLPQYVDVTRASGLGHRFYLDVADFPFHQPNRFVRGRYAILVSVYAENAKRIYQHFEINWSGKWHDDVRNVLKEIVIKPVGPIR